MDYKQALRTTMEKVNQQREEADTELKRLEEEFANVKLNPYGITSIDFAKRQELSSDVLKMEGVVMGIQLALDMLEGAPADVATE